MSQVVGGQHEASRSLEGAGSGRKGLTLMG